MIGIKLLNLSKLIFSKHYYYYLIFYINITNNMPRQIHRSMFSLAVGLSNKGDDIKLLVKFVTHMLNSLLFYIVFRFIIKIYTASILLMWTSLSLIIYLVFDTEYLHHWKLLKQQYIYKCKSQLINILNTLL